jgi:hypothetical protein
MAALSYTTESLLYKGSFPVIKGVALYGLLPRGSAAVIKGLNPSPTPQENSIPRGFAPRLLI